MLREKIFGFISGKPGRLLAAIFAAGLVLAGCSTAPDRAGDSSATTAEGHRAYSHTLTVAVGAGDTRHAVEERYGGEVIAWTENVAEPFAILGFGGLSTQSLQALSHADRCGPGEDLLCLEENGASFLAGGERLHTRGTSRIWDEGTSRIWDEGTSRIWDEGTSRIWDEGTSRIWDEGTSRIWDEGTSRIWDEGSSGSAEYRLFPENTAHWTAVGLDQVQTPEVAYNLGGGVTIAVIDTGVDLDHLFFVDRAVFTPEDTWLNLVDEDDPFNPQERGLESDSAYGHGTNVAGIALQVAPLARIMPIRVLSSEGHGYVTDLVQAVQHAVDHGADIINLSLGAPEPNQAVSSIISWAAQQGVHVVMSAGNTGLREDPLEHGVTFPATLARDGSFAGHEYLLTVTSVDLDGDKSDFASYGASVGLAAPGEWVYGPIPGDYIAPWSGTSMTAPMAAGALALALAEGAGQPDFAADALVSSLTGNGADLYADGQNGAFVDDSTIGFGMMSLPGFLDSVLAAGND